MSNYTLQDLQKAADRAVQLKSYNKAAKETGIVRQVIRAYCIKNGIKIELSRKAVAPAKKVKAPKVKVIPTEEAAPEDF